jgi:hypothetical protein
MRTTTSTLRVVLAGVTLPLAAAGAGAQGYPVKPIRLILECERCKNSTGAEPGPSLESRPAMENW